MRYRIVELKDYVDNLSTVTGGYQAQVKGWLGWKSLSRDVYSDCGGERFTMASYRKTINEAKTDILEDFVKRVKKHNKKSVPKIKPRIVTGFDVNPAHYSHWSYADLADRFGVTLPETLPTEEKTADDSE